MAKQRKPTADERVKVPLSKEERAAIAEELAPTGGYGVGPYIQAVVRNHLRMKGYLGGIDDRRGR
jgi:hypothetical protein